MSATSKFLVDTTRELDRATLHYGPIHSLAEAYGIIAEEVAEFFDEVRKKPHDQQPADIYAELVQIAAMCARTATDLKLTPS